MYVLNVKKAISSIEKEETHNLSSFTLPKNIDREEFMKFFRIMQAKTPDEIADIRTEEIIKMFENITLYMSYFVEKEHPEYGFGKKLMANTGISLVRRVL